VAAHCGKWPVVFVSFGKFTAPTWEEMKLLLIRQISLAFRAHRSLLDADGGLFADERRRFEAILNEDPSALYQGALEDLTALLSRKYQKGVIVLVDKYDKPMSSAHEHGYLDKAVQFLSSVFNGCLKGNPYAILSV